MRRFIFIIFIVWNGWGQTIHAQSGCVLTLREAERLYNQGEFKEVPGLLESCMNRGFTRDERLQAYKLIFQSYYMEDHLDLAEQTMVAFLKKYPEYELTPADPAEFVQLFNSYETIPSWSVSIAANGIVTFPYTTEPFEISSITDYSGKYTTGPGFSAGLGVHKYISKKFEIILEVRYMNHEYNFSLNHYTNTPPVSENPHLTEFKENITNIALPLTTTYEFVSEKWRPYLRGGIMGTYTLSAMLDPVRIYTQGAFEDVAGTNIDMLELRNRLNVYGILGGGIKYKIPYGGLLYFDVRFAMGFTCPVNSANRNTEQTDRIFRYYIMDNDFKFNLFSASIGWIYPLYRSKKQPLIEF